jgi:soluble lytic murein transglycosylase-like protein
MDLREETAAPATGGLGIDLRTAGGIPASGTGSATSGTGRGEAVPECSRLGLNLAALLEDDDVPDDDPFPDVDVALLFPQLRTHAQSRPDPARPVPAPPPVRLASAPSATRPGSPSGRERERRAARIREHVAGRLRGASALESHRISDVILDAASWTRLDPVLILAIIEVESAFDLQARSNRDARGLMQVRPATLWREAERSGLVGDDPYDPGLNVRAGASYFRRLVDSFGMNDVALMAYNAGPNRILGHLRAGGIPERYLEYPRRVRAAEARLRAALSAPPALASRDAPARLQRPD